MAQKFEIKKMTAEDVHIAIDWAREQGWNPGLCDEKCFYQADPQGFFLGLLNGEPIATGSAVAYGDHYAFCGLYIVKAEFRGQGFGLQLTQERLKYAGSRITGLDGVLDKVSKYQRLGYVPAHTNKRYSMSSVPKFTRSSQVTDLKSLSFEKIEEFDRHYFPAPRSSFLRCWINQPQSYALGYLEQQQLRGYGVIRKCFKGYKIGPLFAESPTIAQTLFESLCSQVKEGPVILDIPEPNQNAKLLVKNYGMNSEFEVIRMYRNGNPDINLEGIYGISTFELG